MSCVTVMLDMPVTVMAKNYSHCPLKKRPVHILEELPGRAGVSFVIDGNCVRWVGGEDGSRCWVCWIG